MTIMRKAQSWSIDVVIGSVIFIGAFFTFYYLLGSGTSLTIDDLKDEASIVIKELASPSAAIRLVDNNEINISRIEEVKNLTYEELKRRLRIQSDFCIFLENEKGELVLLNNSYRGIGSPTINISGTPCSQ
jgi:hypothetical protein